MPQALTKPSLLCCGQNTTTDTSNHYSSDLYSFALPLHQKQTAKPAAIGELPIVV